MTELSPLRPEQLAWRCNPDQLGFESTEEVPPLQTLVGQDRALDALGLGLALEAPGYNVYVAGPTGSGRASTVRKEAERIAQRRAPPPDYCYIHNFGVPYRPISLAVPTGKGPELARDVRLLVETASREIPKGFESEEFQRKRSELFQAAAAQHDEVMAEVSTFANRLGFSVQASPGQVMMVPLRENGEPMTPEEFERLTPPVKADMQLRNRQVQQEIDKAFLGLRRLDRDAQVRLDTLGREFAAAAVGPYFDALADKYVQHQQITEFLMAVQADLIEHLGATHDGPPGSDLAATARHQAVEGRYAVNVLVTSSVGAGAPIFFEPNPTYYNLLGRVDYRPGPTGMTTDVTLIKPGALHRANGGFLIIQARDLLLSPNAYEALKRALRDGEIRVENLGDQMNPLPTTSLRPEPIPLKVKVILIGDVYTYLALYQMDEDFSALFKVKAQFATSMERTEESIRAVAGFVSGQVRALGAPPFAKDAVARVIDYASRLAEDQERLATRFDTLANLVAESGHLARQAGAAHVVAEHVDAALLAEDRRVNLPEDEIGRLIRQGTISIDTELEIVGQVNGLSVINLGDHTFGHPSRITASVGVGNRGVVNIEREANLSGPTHSKGVLILGGYLWEKYAAKTPLGLTASIAFEQTYSGVDGDSASGAELCALLSALGDLPIRQSLAMTGSINQRGEIQAVGGVTHKVEGFFDVCRPRGLDGRHGVILPASNVRHLALRREVIEAVAEGKFRIWAVSSVDEAIELLMGIPAGTRQADEVYPKGSVHALVQDRLSAMAQTLKELGPA